ncbi:MAG: di-heme-cytochrome C peroxidase [Verrucomicrobiota bacterium]
MKSDLLCKLGCTAFLLLFSARCEEVKADSAGGKFVYSEKTPKWLDQGWTRDESAEFYLKNQGSELIPFEWFINLEQSDSEQLFRAPESLEALGFIPQPKSRENPFELPIGFILDDNPDTVDIKNVTLSSFEPGYKKSDYPRTQRWLGLTCASCHTADITYEGSVLRIDGGPAMVDHESFLARLTKAMRATCEDPGKFERFRQRNSGPDGLFDTTNLKEELRSYTVHLENLVERNRADHPYGFARLDAFGAILNEITVAALGIPENHRMSDAPVSFPYLWYAPSLDYVQWNRSAENPLGRNVGEVLGVYGHLQLQGTPESGQFRSTARMQNLDRLEKLISMLKAPMWPQETLGPIDQEKAMRGAKLYAQNCAGCHPTRDDKGQYPMTKPNQGGEKFIRTRSIRPEVIGTDPKMVTNFLNRQAYPGVLKKYLKPTDQVPDEVAAALVLKAAVGGVIIRHLNESRLDEELAKGLVANNVSKPENPNTPDGYIARPLHGIWATAPFLHNGSVPNLYQMLLPEERRIKSFLVGSREFDPKNVGFVINQSSGRSFKFETETVDGRPIAGNSNKGHSGPLHTQMQGDDGKFRDFSDAERWDLIEYLKKLN